MINPCRNSTLLNGAYGAVIAVQWEARHIYDIPLYIIMWVDTEIDGAAFRTWVEISGRGEMRRNLREKSHSITIYTPSYIVDNAASAAKRTGERIK